MHNDFYTFWRRAQYIRRQCSAFREKDINLFVHRYLTSRNRGAHSTPLGVINRIRYNQKLRYGCATVIAQNAYMPGARVRPAFVSPHSYICIVYEEIDDHTLYPITAFEIGE